MEKCISEFLKCPDIWTIIGIGIAGFAILLYFKAAKIKWIVYRDGDSLLVETENGNRYRRVYDLECELVLSEYDDFREVQTLELIKSRTLILNQPPDKYTFVTTGRNIQGNPIKIDNFNILRIRWVAANAIGVRKFFQDRIEIKEIQSKRSQEKI